MAQVAERRPQGRGHDLGHGDRAEAGLGFGGPNSRTPLSDDTVWRSTRAWLLLSRAPARASAPSPGLDVAATDGTERMRTEVGVGVQAQVRLHLLHRPGPVDPAVGDVVSDGRGG